MLSEQSLHLWGVATERWDLNTTIGVDARQVGGDLGEAAMHAEVCQDSLNWGRRRLHRSPPSSHTMWVLVVREGANEDLADIPSRDASQ